MTFLELLVDLHEQCGIAGNAPTSVSASTDEMRRLVNWIKRAYLLIQNKRDDWLWMQGEFTFQTQADKRDYTVATNVLDATTASVVGPRFRRWRNESFRCWKVSEGRASEQFLVHWHYDTFRDTYLFAGQLDQRNRPVVWAKRPWDQAILLADCPDGVYQVVGQYQKGPHTLVDNDSIPEMPDQFHPIIVYRAMMFYGLFESAPDVLSHGQVEFERLMTDLVRDQVPETCLADPLA